MLRYLYGSQLDAYPKLSDTMFRDRAAQFRDRLKWDVAVDAQGYERDEYDACDPLYVIWQQPDGSHGGSMRFLPTTGPTMVNDHFSDLMDGDRVQSPHIWESTRFCLSCDSNSRVAAALVLGGIEIGRGFGITQCVGVFDARMVRIYRMIGASPDVLGSTGEGRAKISVGLWTFDPIDRMRVLLRAGVSSTVSEHWYARAFGSRPLKLQARAA
ncbi:acyl-homoserine-lactone synthase [Pseudooctadecabacter jejudonensis]|uniref:Acyl-homoserine-lactone synthase n=1 Tax=Pseudooctadecabacter jejudonensis TaxID=1391910 RepID=A0A1Y5RZK5_9RHOB|nr:acyl-homoserine-lactone synthase [Pseudooctadecabacter jejudonensis]SLN26219.1 Acyl-homoserine-lactone synthase [Pseudooctadecabacter jejudonensis]